MWLTEELDEEVTEVLRAVDVVAVLIEEADVRTEEVDARVDDTLELLLLLVELDFFVDENDDVLVDEAVEEGQVGVSFRLVQEADPVTVLVYVFPSEVARLLHVHGAVGQVGVSFRLVQEADPVTVLVLILPSEVARLLHVHGAVVVDALEEVVV
ncbi:uncharacterized protein BDZ99DRAFT_553772 [Mytilinidion resinicola]|uniref:Uncharacterized protein n=1 Tax=Mytilinidion resinicola TaxID=574789 RepID=A0A6A6Z0L4_9PEZI|nr:uncharacterized protein BDZ99DRAFT_553772 [Mytilinidion resinicola]KAF2813814.1 hypothetical protein BDZ99DRAFT_553772 [Mytilinidion resinicola]